MTTFTAHESRGEPDYLIAMLGLDGAEDVPTGDLKGSARRHSRKRVVGVKA